MKIKSSWRDFLPRWNNYEKGGGAEEWWRRETFPLPAKPAERQRRTNTDTNRTPSLTTGAPANTHINTRRWIQQHWEGRDEEDCFQESQGRGEHEETHNHSHTHVGTEILTTKPGIKYFDTLQSTPCLCWNTLPLVSVSVFFNRLTSTTVLQTHYHDHNHVRKSSENHKHLREFFLSGWK